MRAEVPPMLVCTIWRSVRPPKLAWPMGLADTAQVPTQGARVDDACAVPPAHRAAARRRANGERRSETPDICMGRAWSMGSAVFPGRMLLALHDSRAYGGSADGITFLRPFRALHPLPRTRLDPGGAHGG